MWQRIQTLYLGLSILINASIFFLPLAIVKGEGQTAIYNIHGLFDEETGEKLGDSFILLVYLIALILVSFIIITMFKKRQLQIKLSQLNLFLQAGFLAPIFFVMDWAQLNMSLVNEPIVEYQLGTFLALVPLLLIYLAVRGIKKDEALVRAADRIR